MTGQPHVRVETRKVYISARGPKLTRHSAYMGAAKKLIADKCTVLTDAERKRLDAFDPERFHGTSCEKDGDWQCRFHEQTEVYVEDELNGNSMVHYCRVLTRLTRFLKFVDSRMETP